MDRAGGGDKLSVANILAVISNALGMLLPYLT